MRKIDPAKSNVGNKVHTSEEVKELKEEFNKKLAQFDRMDDAVSRYMIRAEIQRIHDKLKLLGIPMENNKLRI